MSTTSNGTVEGPASPAPETAQQAASTLWTALLAFQAEAPTLRKDKTNPAFRSKYISLDAVVDAVKPLLTKHELLWITMPTRDETGEPALAYRLAHAPTGEAITGVMPLMLAKADPQGQGSAITYARRYCTLAVLDLVADEDDDGNAASRGRQTNGASGRGVTADAVEPTRRAATAKQRGLINARASEANLEPAQLAAAILRVAGQQPREFDDPEAELRFVQRQLERLPADLVDPLLAEVQALAGATTEDVPF